MINDIEPVQSKNVDNKYVEEQNRINQELGAVAGTVSELSSDPNGSLSGKKRETAFYIDGASIYFCICAGGTVWRKVQLT